MPVVNLTKKTPDELPLPPGCKRVFYPGSVIRGLGVWVTSKGVKTFIVYRKVEGKPQRTTLGRYPATKIAQARKKAEQINGQIADEKNPNAEQRRARAEPTLGELYARYGDGCESRSSRQSSDAVPATAIYSPHPHKRMELTP